MAANALELLQEKGLWCPAEVLVMDRSPCRGSARTLLKDCLFQSKSDLEYARQPKSRMMMIMMMMMIIIIIIIIISVKKSKNYLPTKITAQ
jgi:hypothetical protein